MFYIKVEHAGQTAKLAIDAVYSDCFRCGKEIEVDSETLSTVLEDGDFSSRISCGCTDGMPKITRIK